LTSTATTRRRAASTKADIVDAAAALFAERGFAAVGVQEIGERVGITGGAIYRHFSSKESVLEAVLFDSIAAWLEAAEPGTSDDAIEPPVHRVIRRSVQLVVDRPGQLATYVRERHRVRGPARRELARQESALFESWAAAILAARPGLPRAELVVRQQAVNGVLSSLALRPGGLGHSRLRALVTDGLLALVTAPPHPPAGDPVPATRSWQAPTPRREQIIAVAVRLFADRGFHGVAMEDIGEAVGMSAPSLYEHVAGKADILLDAYDRAGAFVVAGAAEALAAATSASDALDRLVRSYVEVAFAHVDLIVVTSREGSSLTPSERPRLARRRRDMHERWAAVLRELRPQVSPGDARIIVRSAMAMVSALARQRRDGSPSIEATSGLVRAFLTPTKEQP
jgi:AcrR family transcriptional regulator